MPYIFSRSRKLLTLLLLSALVSSFARVGRSRASENLQHLWDVSDVVCRGTVAAVEESPGQVSGASPRSWNITLVMDRVYKHETAAAPSVSLTFREEYG